MSITRAQVADLRVLADELESLHKAATPGRWIADSSEIYQEWPGIAGLTGNWIGETCRIEGDPLHATTEADAALIVGVVNALPEVIAALRLLVDGETGQVVP